MNEHLHRIGPVSQWQHAIDLLAEARRLAPLMKAREGSPMRDAATQAYVEAVDELVAVLGVMADTGALEPVSEYFAVVYGG
ncbi:MAG: hypothetical protein K0B16_14855 [Burkholderiaceae bacterium]|nr:hypothetical protein [Burkholderiaceae bacterium]